MTTINVGISLPRDAVTQKIAFLGRTGSGKTYGASKLAEEFHKIGAQFVVVDPVGVWWGLRLASNGKAAGISIPVFGGLHGDIPLEPSAGKLFADLIVDRGISAILDISQFEYNADKARFAEDFAARFFFKKKASPSAIHLFLEEAQEFIPQNPSKGEERMLGAFERLWKLGRNFGIGGSLISQRPQEVNKKALNQTECLFAFQMTGTHERKAIESWIADKGIDEDIVGILPKLEIGQPRVWSPQWLKISKTIHISKKETFNASSTPEVGKHSTSVKNLAPIELEKIKEEMKSTVEKAQAEDPKILQKRVRELEFQLKTQKPHSDEKSLSRLREEYQKRMEREIHISVERASRENQIAFQNHIRKIEFANKDLQNRIIQIAKIAGTKANIQPIEKVPISQPRIMAFPQISRQAIHQEAQASIRLDGETHSFDNSEKITGGALRMLKAAAMFYPHPITKARMAAIAGLSHRSGTFGTYTASLIRQGYLERHGDSFKATEAGMQSVGDVPELPTDPESLIKMWMGILKGGPARMLRVVADRYPDSINKEDLGEQTGFSSNSGTFGTYLAVLKRNGLIKVHGKEISLSEEIYSD